MSESLTVQLLFLTSQSKGFIINGRIDKRLLVVWTVILCLSLPKTAALPLAYDLEQAAAAVKGGFTLDTVTLFWTFLGALWFLAENILGHSVDQLHL